MSQGFVTVLLPFDRSKAQAVDQRLAELGNFANAPARAALDRASFVHFMSITVVCEEDDANACLILEASVDGDPAGALARIAEGEIARQLLPVLEAAGHEIPSAGPALAAYLEKHRHDLGTAMHQTLGLAFAGTPGMHVARIRAEAQLVRRIRQRLDEPDTLQMTATEKMQCARDLAFGDAGLKRGLIAESVPPSDQPEPLSVLEILASFMRLLWPLALAPVLCVLVSAWWAADHASGSHTFPHVTPRALVPGAIGALLGLLVVRNALGAVRAVLWGAILGAFVGAMLGGLAAVFPEIELGAVMGTLLGVLGGARSLRSTLGTLAGALGGLALGIFLGTAYGAVPGAITGAVWGGACGLALPALLNDRDFADADLGAVAGAIAGILIGAPCGALLHAFGAPLLGGHIVWAALLCALLALSLLAPRPGIVGLATAAGLGVLLVVLSDAIVPVIVLAGSLVVAFAGGIVGSIVGATVFAAQFTAVLLLLGIAYAMLRVSEEVDTPEDREPDSGAVARILALENQTAQNHLAGVSVIKAGGVRRLALHLVFWFIGEFGRYLDRPGYICGIGTIHFARWLVLPGTNKLLFYSNYDGSWESYLEDFIARAHGGLSAIWSNTLDFPKTRSLVIGGASDGERFKRWARRQQRPTLFWYSAYPELTTQHIRDNAQICHGLAAARTDADAARWLELMQYRAPSTVEAHEVPALVFGGLKPLRHSRCLMVALAEDAGKCGLWIESIRGRVQYGEDRPGQDAVVLGFTHTGLRKLGLERALGSFPAAFHQGMAAPGRAVALGDVGADEPARWLWGGPTKPADAVLVAYADSAERLDRYCEALRADLRGAGHEVAHELALDPLPPKGAPAAKEPFGFADGISQPILKGSRKWVTQRNPIHVVEPGEMVLGYTDNLGSVAPVPMHDGFDLGTNGSYLVVRQLEQNPAAFHKFAADRASELESDPRVPTAASLAPARLKDWIAAKMVGRWQDGSSLVRSPARPALESKAAKYPDNDFLLGTEDPDGLCCPFGAHIRRANPRESFDPGSQTQLGITNRHRIFRVGRFYGPQGKLEKPGLLFMCVNADIERQFEFLQQTWILGANFHGLSDEVDPAVGYRPDREDGKRYTIATSDEEREERYTIPTEKGPIRLRGLQNFVTMRGGGYFFMPSRRVIDYLRDCALGREPAQDAPGY